MRIRLRKLLDDNAEAIVESWQAEARKSAAAQGLTRAELVSRLPAILASLMRTEGPSEGSDALGQRWLIVSHLADRLRHGFELVEMIEEFRILGRAIEATWAAIPQTEKPDPLEIERMQAELGTAMTAATALFDENLVQYQQREKQFLRRLQGVASDSETAFAPNLRPVQMLEVISDALSAETTGLYYYEPEHKQLRLVASTGLEDDLKKRYVTPLGAPSFASHLAESPKTVYLADVAKSDLEVPEPLRKTRARSILGMPLRSRGVLFGALYVGFRESRVFEPREVRMFESLGERFALLLDDARVHGALEDTNQQLRIERELRDRFIAMLAHDLLGPLASAKMGIQLLTTHPELLTARDSLPAQILKDLDRTDGMVRDMLDVHQIRAGHRLTLRLGKTDLVAVAREVVQELEVVHGERFVVKSEEHEWGFWSERDMRRALFNLTTNAIKYGSQTAPVEILIASVAGKIKLTVTNQGPVIPTIEHPALFEPFSRAVSVQAAAKHGWGLGLTLVKGCVEAHGGTVEIESDPGKGTTFTLRFPTDGRPFQPGANPP